MEFLKKLEWKQIAIALAALGVISSSDPDSAFISVVAMLVVLIINLAAKLYDKPISKSWVSMLVYAVAFGLTLASQWTAIGWPVWTGEPAQYTEQLALVLADFGPVALALTGSATILYNALSKLVFEKIEEKVLGE